MSYERFEYSKIDKTNGPIIPFQIKAEGQWHEIWAYVDSGASYSILKAEEAVRLGIAIHKGKKISVTVGSGEKISVFLHKLKIKIGKEELIAIIGFSKELRIELNLIGRKDIFETFKVCFSDSKGILTFQREK